MLQRAGRSVDDAGGKLFPPRQSSCMPGTGSNVRVLVKVQIGDCHRAGAVKSAGYRVPDKPSDS